METKQNLRVAEVKLTYKTTVKATDRPQINSSIDVHRVLQSNWNFEIIEFIEEFKIILLNRANRVLGIAPISVGGTSGTVADPKVIFVSALKCNAASIILVHNHPSGNLKPSEADKQITNKIRQAAKLMDIEVLDHLILSTNGFFSFGDKGIL
jgi:DNA repair protein RadC